MTETGDNGGPKLKKLTAVRKVERIREVLEMDISSAQKCIGVSIICDADTDGITPELSTEDLKRRASVKDRETVYRATRKLDEVRVSKPVKTHGRPNRYIVLSDDEIDAAIEEIEDTSPVQPDALLRPNPTGITTDTSPVQPDHPVRFNPTGQVQPDGPSQQDAPSRARDNTSHATKESPTEIVTYEELAKKLASSAREETDQVAEELAGSLAGLNGSSEPMISDILGWMNCGDKRSARQWLATTLHTFGQTVTAESYQKLKTDIAEGVVIARPLQTWSKIAQRMKADPKSAAASTKDTLASKRERIRKHMQEVEAECRAKQQQWGNR